LIKLHETPPAFEAGSASIVRLPCPPHEVAGSLHDDEQGGDASRPHLTGVFLAPRFLISLQRP
jgi:hypothetical protein